MFYLVITVRLLEPDQSELYLRIKDKDLFLKWTNNIEEYEQ